MGRKGRIFVFTGEGKGKTTRALGMALQAVARGLSAYMVQFMKAPDSPRGTFCGQAARLWVYYRAYGKKGLHSQATRR